MEALSSKMLWALMLDVSMNPLLLVDRDARGDDVRRPARQGR
jgi:hypothetical protein